MAMRWKLEPHETGMRSAFAGPRASKLRDGDVVYAVVYAMRSGGWYWVAGWDSDVPHKNTCDHAVATAEEAKAAAMAYVRQHVEPMKELAGLVALSIRQPWAWLIVHGFKDIENRSWATKFRGRFLVHASKGMTKDEYAWARSFAILGVPDMPRFEDLERGGIVGVADLVDCVEASKSPWYMGEKGFVLANARPLPFVALKGKLNFFETQYSLADDALIPISSGQAA